MSKRQSHARWLSLAAEMRRDGQIRFAKKLVAEARRLRYCPYHKAHDALLALP